MKVDWRKKRKVDQLGTNQSFNTFNYDQKSTQGCITKQTHKIRLGQRNILYHFQSKTVSIFSRKLCPLPVLMNQEAKSPLFLTVSPLKELKEEKKTVCSSSANLLFPSLILPSPTPSQSSLIASSSFSFAAQSAPGSNVTITEKATNNLIHESTRRKEREGKKSTRQKGREGKKSVQENPSFFPSPDPLKQASNPTASTNGTPLKGSTKPAGEEEKGKEEEGKREKEEGERETSSIESGGTTQAATLLFKGITTTRRSGTETKTGKEEEGGKGNVEKEREVAGREVVEREVVKKERGIGKKGEFFLSKEREGRKVNEKQGEERGEKGNWCSTSLQLTSPGKKGAEESSSFLSSSSHIQSSYSSNELLFSSIKPLVSLTGHNNDQGKDLNNIQHPSTTTTTGLATTGTRGKDPFTASLARRMTKTTASSDSTTGSNPGTSTTTRSEESVTIGSSDNSSPITSSSSTKSSSIHDASSVSKPSIPSSEPSSSSSAPSSSSTAECPSDTVSGSASNSGPSVTGASGSGQTEETTVTTDVVETTHSTACSLPSLCIPSHSNPLPSTSSSSSPAPSSASLSQVTALSQNVSSASGSGDKASPVFVAPTSSSLEQQPLSTTIVTQSSQGGLDSILPGKTPPTITTPASVTNVSTKVSTMSTTTDSAVSSSDQGSGSGEGKPLETSSSQPGSSSLSSGPVTMSDQPASRSPPFDPQETTPVQVSRSPQEVTPVQMSRSPQGTGGGLNEASSTSSDPSSNLMKRAITTTTGSSESALGTTLGAGDGGDREPDTHGSPAKRSKRSSSSFRSTNSSSNTDNGIQPSSVPSSASFPNEPMPSLKEEPMPSLKEGETEVMPSLMEEAMPSLMEGVKDTSSTPTTMTTSSTSDTIPSRLKQQQAPPADVIQSSQASGHEDITDSEEEDEGKMMIDEDASSDREAKTTTTAAAVALSTNT